MYRVAQEYRTGNNATSEHNEISKQPRDFSYEYGRDSATILNLKKIILVFSKSYGYLYILCHVFNLAPWGIFEPSETCSPKPWICPSHDWSLLVNK